MKLKLLKMLELQDAMNTRISSEWRLAGNQWYRAVWIECAEMLDHYGWKWWKHQKPDMDQVILEIVDIWHFILSDLLENSESPEAVAEALMAVFDSDAAPVDIPAAIETLAEKTLQHRTADPQAFVSLMRSVSLDLDALYRGYIGKNVLNFFRQDHGYQDGSYHKLWGGREDNEYLVDAAASLNSDSASFQDDLYNALQEKYSKHCQ